MKTGYGVFGKAYEIMLKNDPHDPASIDHALLRDMILLDDGSAPILYAGVKRFDLRDHELYEFARQFKKSGDRESVRAVLDYTSRIAMEYDVDFRDMVFGGTEKQILERGTDWCADMARVGAVLLQCLGIPCRIVHLADLARAYNGHVVGEAYYEGRWGVVDLIYGYQFYDVRPIGAYDVLQNPDHLKPYPEDYRGLFSAVAVSEYDPTDKNNNYAVSGPNDYTMKLIYTAHNYQWIMGESDE